MKNYLPLEYLKIDISNMRGLDHEQFEDRIAWVQRIEASDVKLEDYVEYAKKKYQYTAAVLAYRDALAGKPTGHLAGLDACASGPSLMGVFMGCKITCSNTGMIGKFRKDMYEQCTKTMNKLLDTAIEIDSKIVKGAQMPWFYGSEQEPKNIFGEDTPELMAFHSAQEIVAPGAVFLRNELLMSWQAFEPNHTWTMPDGFEVIKPVLQKAESKIEIDELDHASIQYVYEVNVGTEKGLSLAADAVHSCDALAVREVGRRCNYDREQLVQIQTVLLIRLADPRPTIRQRVPKIEQLWRDHGFLSLVGIEHMCKTDPNDFNKDYCEALLELSEATLEYQSFECLYIHKSLWM
jgi:hypothetical protein